MIPFSNTTQNAACRAAADKGDFDDLITGLYGELRMLARRELSGRKVNLPVQTTSLVHEAYLRLSRNAQGRLLDHAECLAAAVISMRRILVEEIRSMKRLKRGGAWTRVCLDSVHSPSTSRIDFVDLSDALERLTINDPRKAMIVQMRFFGGLTNEEIAETLKVTTRTVERDWQYARAWLFRELSPSRTSENGKSDVN